MQLELFKPEDVTQPERKARPGVTWWTGAWECRNHHGFFQSREGGVGHWQFQVPWFANDDRTCTVYGIDDQGELFHIDQVPIDEQNRITILGRKWCNRHWEH